MINLQNSEYLFRNPWVWTVNTVGQLMEAIVFFYFIRKIFTLKKGKTEKKRQWIVAVVLYTAALAGIDLITNNNMIWYVTVMIGIPFGYSIYFYRGKFYEKLIICITFFSILISLEHMGIMMGNLFFPFPTDLQWLTIFFIRRVCMKFLLIPIGNFLAYHGVKMEGRLSLWYWLMLGSVCLVEDFAAQKIMGILSRSNSWRVSDILLPISWVMIPVVFYLFISVLLKNSEIQKTNVVQATYLKIQHQYLEQMMELQESLRQAERDSKAHFLCVDTLLEAGEYEEAREYLANISMQPSNENEIVNYTENKSLNLILGQKKRMADKLGLHFEVEAALPENGIVEIYDLNMLVMNLCDNAIEAAAKVKDGFVRLKIVRKKAYLQIEAENSTIFNVMEKNPDFVTNKGKKDVHGLGIKIVKNIVEKYDGVYKTSSTDSVFTTVILLKDENGY